MSRTISKKKIEQFKIFLLEDEKANETIVKYIRELEAFLCFIGENTVSKEKVIKYKHHLMACYAPTSVNCKLAAINRFLRWQGWYDCTVKALKIQRQAFRPKERELSKDEYFRLLKVAKEKKNKRLYLMMQAICSTGIRVGELQFITVEAVRQERATVSFKGKTRQVLIPRNLLAELRKYIKERGLKSGSIFVTRSGKPVNRNNILYEMKALCERAKVERSKVFPHNLRHLFACIYYKREKDLSRLADILGHSNINTTRIYTSVSGDEQQLKIESLGLLLDFKCGIAEHSLCNKWLFPEKSNP